jgi:hypothetical protein
MLQVYIDELQARVKTVVAAELRAMHAENEKTIEELTRDYHSYSNEARASTRRYLTDAEQRRRIYRLELSARGLDW